MTFIFDFDGTLVDSMPAFANTMIRILEENHIEYPQDFIKIITPLGYKGTAEYAIELGLDMEADDFIETAVNYISTEYEHNIPAKNFVKEKLTELKKQGHSLNVLTASPHSVLDVCLKRLGLYELFDNVWSSDDFEYTKSEPQIYCEAAKRLNTKVQECYFADDNINAILTAKKAGMNTIGVFDQSGKAFADEMKNVADRYIMSFDEL